MVEEPFDARGFKQKSGGKSSVRIAVLPGRRSWRDQDLEAQRQSRVAGLNRTHGGKRPARTVTGNGQPGGVQAECCRAMPSQPLQCRPAVEHRARKAMLGCKTIFDRNNCGTTALGELAAEAVVRFEIPDREPAPVQVQRNRQSVLRGRIQTCPQGAAVRRGNREVLDPCQRRARQFKHLGRRFVGEPRLLNAHRVERRSVGTPDRFEHARHLRRQGGWCGNQKIESRSMPWRIMRRLSLSNASCWIWRIRSRVKPSRSARISNVSGSRSRSP